MRKDSGFSLIQLLIVAGMLSGIFLVSLKLMHNQKDLGRSSSEEFEITYLFDDIRNLLADTKNCTSTLEGIDPFSVSSLKRIKRGEKTFFEVFEERGLKYGQKNLKINALEFVGDEGEVQVETGEAVFKVVFEKSRTALGERLVEKKLKLHLKLEEGKISSCFALPGINLERPSERDARLWRKGSNEEDIFTESNWLNIKTSKKHLDFSLAMAGKLKIFDKDILCTVNKHGIIRFFNGRLEFCSKRGWAELWGGVTGESARSFSLKSNKDHKKIVTEEGFKICGISEHQLHGANCKRRRIDGNLWELSLEYIRGEDSSCTFRCLR